MKKVILTLAFAAVGLAAIIWACTYKFSGLAWFPGFFVALCCFIKCLDINKVGQENKKSTLQ